ncbi:hypothetical protein [Brunnivagina elsteri]|uniref:hypothetical protein n=1 Tax=Brunnivagina elsteri TaxID=1247191 RepID=UPI001B80292D|nr:hypothetical protein [Calothrix elsteri]
MFCNGEKFVGTEYDTQNYGGFYPDTKRKSCHGRGYGQWQSLHAALLLLGN